MAMFPRFFFLLASVLIRILGLWLLLFWMRVNFRAKHPLILDVGEDISYHTQGRMYPSSMPSPHTTRSHVQYVLHMCSMSACAGCWLC